MTEYNGRYTQKQLIDKMNSSDCAERYEAAQWIDQFLLPQLMNDEDSSVRCWVALRICKENAVLMWCLDENETVRSHAKRNIFVGTVP
jgi:hypothetical protein